MQAAELGLNEEMFEVTHNSGSNSCHTYDNNNNDDYENNNNNDNRWCTCQWTRSKDNV